VNPVGGAQANGGSGTRGTGDAVSAASERGAAIEDQACPNPVQKRGDVQTR